MVEIMTNTFLMSILKVHLLGLPQIERWSNNLRHVHHSCAHLWSKCWKFFDSQSGICSSWYQNSYITEQECQGAYEPLPWSLYLSYSIVPSQVPSFELLRGNCNIYKAKEFITLLIFTYRKTFSVRTAKTKFMLSLPFSAKMGIVLIIHFEAVCTQFEASFYKGHSICRKREIKKWSCTRNSLKNYLQIQYLFIDCTLRRVLEPD